MSRYFVQEVYGKRFSGVNPKERKNFKNRYFQNYVSVVNRNTQFLRVHFLGAENSRSVLKCYGTHESFLCGHTLFSASLLKRIALLRGRPRFSIRCFFFHLKSDLPALSKYQKKNCKSLNVGLEWWFHLTIRIGRIFPAICFTVYFIIYLPSKLYRNRYALRRLILHKPVYVSLVRLWFTLQIKRLVLIWIHVGNLLWKKE